MEKVESNIQMPFVAAFVDRKKREREKKEKSFYIKKGNDNNWNECKKSNKRKG